jgi:hypothetical protein
MERSHGGVLLSLALLTFYGCAGEDATRGASAGKSGAGVDAGSAGSGGHAGTVGFTARGGSASGAGSGGTLAARGGSANAGGGAVLGGGAGGSAAGLGGRIEGGNGGASNGGGRTVEPEGGSTGDAEGGASARTGGGEGGAGESDTSGGGEAGQACVPLGELIENGDFESRGVALTTEYELVTAPEQIGDTGECIIAPNASRVRVGADDWAAFGDHTSGRGNMLICDGAVTNRYVWQEMLSVEPEAEYIVHFWFASVQAGAANLPALQPFADGVAIGDALPAAASGAWTEYTAVYRAGDNTTVALSIADASTRETQNDFALDDVSFAFPCAQ